MSVATLNTKRDAAVEAIADGDYATALTNLRACKALLATMPDTRHGEDSLTWNRTDIDQLIAECNRARAAAAGVQRSKVTYANPTSDDA